MSRQAPTPISAWGLAMPTLIVLLRAVNVAGSGAVAMADLRHHLSAAGYGRVRTVLQSGNIVLDAPDGADAALERRLEAELGARLGLSTTVFVRDLAEWDALIAANPFPGEARRDPSHLLVLAAATPPSAEAVARLVAGHDGPERIAAGTRHLTVYYPDGIGRSKLTNARIERHLGGPVTGRNWNTVSKLRELAQT